MSNCLVIVMYQRKDTGRDLLTIDTKEIVLFVAQCTKLQ